MRHLFPDNPDLFNAVLSDESLDNKVIRMWSKREVDATQFYQTGFETLLFKKDRRFALETVLSSVVSIDDQVLIAGFGVPLEEMINKAEALSLDYQSFNWFSGGWSRLLQIIGSSRQLNTILIGIDAQTEVNDIPVEELVAAASQTKSRLIVYCETDVDGLNDQFKNAIDFMIGECDCHPHQSFVVARRSKLVQTEGVSRSFNLNLYNYWQWSMRKRNPVIEPMCG